jgi:bifunctional non-homologous end joining protein LigD
VNVLRFPVLPMKATMGSTNSVPEGDDWAFEIKWDGYRTIAFVDGGSDGHVRLQSTAGHDVTARWPEIGGVAGALNAPSAILDGELVAVDDTGRPNFGRLQQSGVGSGYETVYYVFDVLQVDGTDTIDLAYVDRRRLLDGMLEAGDNWIVPSMRIGGGDELLALTAAQQLEGVIAKRVDSRYRPGTRSKEWRKIKNRITTTVTIGGFTTGTGNRSSTFGALLVGTRADTRLAFAGGVGTGFGQRTLESLVSRLRSLQTDECPFDPPPPAPVRRTATWVRPELQAEVEIAEFTNEGLVRHASFVRLTE